MSTDVRTILKLRVPVIVQIARRRTPLEEVLGLAPGSILEFAKSADDELDLLVSNKQIGKGVAVKVGENFGLRITAIGAARQRVAAMGLGGGEGSGEQGDGEGSPSSTGGSAGEAPGEAGDRGGQTQP